MLIEAVPIGQNFVDSSSGAVTVEGEGSDSFAMLNKVPDKTSTTSSVPNVDGATTNGGRKSPAAEKQQRSG